MKGKYLTVKSVTNAMKSKEILKKQGFDVTVERAPTSINPDGCSFAINIKRGNINVAETLLSTAGIDVIGRGGVL